MNKKIPRRTATVATAGSTSTAAGPIAKSNPIPQPRLITIFCWILGVSTSEFQVDIEDSLTVGHLKDRILEKNLNTLPGIDAAQLTLWNVSIQVSRQLKNQVNEHQFLEELSLLGGELLREIFSPPSKTLHIVSSLCAPTSAALSRRLLHSLRANLHFAVSATITSSRSSDSNIAAYIALKHPHPESPDDLGSTKRTRGDDDGWLSELHGKIWNRKDRLQELFHTVEITMAHYDELQGRLDKLYPNRHTPEYMAGSKSVQSTKLDILRTFQPPWASLIPELAPHTGDKQAETNENNDDDELRSIFPITITYIDLSCLQLEDMTLRMPLVFLFRDEYKILDGIVDGLQDSGIISGQPGTGKTTYIHLRIIGSMLNGEPFLYQSLSGTVYHVSDIVTIVTSLPSGSADIVAYVDANEKKFEPQQFIRCPRVKIIAASSPSGTDQPWLKQMGNYAFPLTFASALWTNTELFVTGIFLHPLDLTYARLKEATTYFGFSPRLCFNASREERQLRELQNKVKTAVKKAASKRDIRALIFSYENSMMLSHAIFELSPRDDFRLFGDALIGTVSPWALDLLLGAYEAQNLDAAFEFYKSISDIPKAGTLRGRILERQMLKYFHSLSPRAT